jgi:DNA methylase
VSTQAVERNCPVEDLQRRLLGLDQARLNIEARSRTSRLPWRGQFSPELVEYIMEIICPDSRRFLDPFCGSGTVLYEAAEMGHSAFGLEVNPAAWHLASLADFGALPIDEKAHTLRRLKSITAASSHGSSGMFRNEDPTGKFMKAIADEPHSFLQRALASVVLLGMGDGAELSPTAIARGGFLVTALLNNLMTVTGVGKALLGDARQMPLDDSSIDSIISSPPYINVFNYHQNYRPAAELLGWNPLQAARSEIGANRKHRMNRFLTVIQYCMDMAQCLNEFARVLEQDSPLVLVLGRTSNVLGASFANGQIFVDLLESGSGFRKPHLAERVFTNRFGAQIFEDLLITTRASGDVISLDGARAVGIAALEKARSEVPDKNRATLEEAIGKGADVATSPLLDISVPNCFIPTTSTAAAHASH